MRGKHALTHAQRTDAAERYIAGESADALAAEYGVRPQRVALWALDYERQQGAWHPGAVISTERRSPQDRWRAAGCAIERHSPDRFKELLSGVETIATENRKIEKIMPRSGHDPRERIKRESTKPTDGNVN